MLPFSGSKRKFRHTRFQTGRADMNDKEEQYRNAVAALNHYMKNRNNPLSGPEYEKLKNAMFTAYNEVRSERLCEEVSKP
jgi:hypothetical protein